MSWPPAGHDRQRELFSADAEPCEPRGAAGCEHRVGRVETYEGDAEVEIEVQCADCGAWLNGVVDVAELDERAVAARGGR